MSADRWVLVPVEPTGEMLRAAVVYANGNAVYKNVAAEALLIEESIYGEVYAAMLAAAPAAPAAEPVATALRVARDRLRDMLAGDDGQAWQEAERALPMIEAALSEPGAAPAAESPVPPMEELVRALLDGVMNFRHTRDGMVRGGEYVLADALIDAAAAHGSGSKP